MSHAKRSPSGAHRWGTCPASLTEEAKYPDKSGPAAKDGTHTHTLLDHCQTNSADPLNMVGITLTDHEGDFTVDAERAERVKFALDYIRQRQIDMAPASVQSEKGVDPTPLLGIEGSNGTADILIKGQKMLEVIDYKDGMSPVSAEGNSQMELYALGSLCYFGNSDELETIRMTIIQPKLRLKGLKGISSHEISLSDLKAKAFEYTMKAMATEAENPEYVPGESQCKWCKAKGNCKAFADYNAQSLDMDPLKLVDDASKVEPNELSDERIRELLNAAPLIRSLLDAAQEEALRRFEAGHTIDGLKVVRGRGSRSWSLDEAEMVERLRKMGVPKDKVYVSKLVSPAQVEKLTWVKKVKGEEVKASLSDRQLKTLSSEYIKKSEGKPTVVAESDERKAIEVKPVSEMFKPVESVPDWMKGE